jgi:aryl-alcohol dehydrogenase-like predicted oxidoreductase
MTFSQMFLGLHTDAQRAIQFARSTPGISSALVGMRQVAHVVENLAISRIPPLASADYRRLFFRNSTGDAETRAR